MGKRMRNQQKVPLDNIAEFTPRIKADKTPIKPKNEAQKLYLNAVRTSPVSFGVGPAGTGKTFIAVAEAASMLADRQIEKLVITRPAVEAGESLGFLPGELDEKFDPYFAPVREILNRRLGEGYTEALIKSGKIEAKPLAFMRGHTFENAFVIFDEAQNATPKQMELFLGRIGNHTKVVVDGDPAQKDIPGRSGLVEAMNLMRHYEWCQVVEFTEEDIVRSGIARDVVIAYSRHRKSERSEKDSQIDKKLPFLTGWKKPATTEI